MLSFDIMSSINRNLFSSVTRTLLLEQVHASILKETLRGLFLGYQQGSVTEDTLQSELNQIAGHTLASLTGPRNETLWLVFRVSCSPFVSNFCIEITNPGVILLRVPALEVRNKEVSVDECVAAFLYLLDTVQNLVTKKSRKRLFAKCANQVLDDDSTKQEIKELYYTIVSNHRYYVKGNMLQLNTLLQLLGLVVVIRRIIYNLIQFPFSIAKFPDNTSGYYTLSLGSVVHLYSYVRKYVKSPLPISQLGGKTQKLFSSLLTKMMSRVYPLVFSTSVPSLYNDVQALETMCYSIVRISILEDNELRTGDKSIAIKYLNLVSDAWDTWLKQKVTLLTNELSSQTYGT